MEKFKTLNETELISVVGGIFTGGNPFGVAGGWATAFATPFCN